MSDGPVSAKVTIGEQTFDTKPELRAWVLCGPPKYTTDIASPTTLYDVMENVYEDAKRKQQGSDYDGMVNLQAVR
jgi:hypothetical protein